MTTQIFACVGFLTLVCLSENAKILGIFPSTGYSQYILGSSLMKALAARGHEVTMVSSFAQKPPVPNFKEIVMTTKVDFDKGLNLYDLNSIDIFTNAIMWYDMYGLPITENALKDKGVQELLHSTATFDLVICELFLNEAHMAFAHHYQAPLVLLSSLGASEWSNPLVANPAPYSITPITSTGYSDHMDFWQRLRNTAVGLFKTFYKHAFTYPKQNKLLRKYFPDAPDLKDLIYNASLILLNSNVAMNAPVAHVPSMVEIGGFHVSPKKLPKDWQEFLDKAQDGVVFFSMGSNLKSSDLPKETLDGILRVFSRLKQQVVWKWEKEDLPGKPPNVRIHKWLPQQDILAHPNVHAFISHGGLLSTTEAVYNGVPMVCIPVFGDQHMNTIIAVGQGYAVEIPFPELGEQTLSWALDEVLKKPSYRETAQRRSRVLRDQPLQPMDNAIFWIEYVMRHEGAPHLRTAALKLHWYQYLLLDVLAFVIVAIAMLVLLCKIIIGRLFRSNRSSLASSRKKTD